MTYAAVLTHVQPDPDGRAALACAVDIAKRFDAALIGVAAEMIPPLAFDGGYYSAGGRLDERDARDHRRPAQDARAACSRRRPPTFGDKRRLRLRRAAARAGHRRRLARRRPDRGGRRAAQRCTTPTDTARPPNSPSPPAARCWSRRRARRRCRPSRCCWPGRTPARRAAPCRDAHPVLRAGRPRGRGRGLPRRATLSRRCIEVDDVVARPAAGAGSPPRRRSSQETHPHGYHILRQASLEGADLIVCGAYGHSRLGEWVFGGVTADLLVTGSGLPAA